MIKNFKYLIIGGGPTGLGAGYRLRELGERSFCVLERNSHVGGLSASFKDEQGFTWDIGGHVLFSHYDYFDRLLDSLMGSDTLEHQRESWIRISKTWVPYPFQNNIRYLPRELTWECVRGLMDIESGRAPKNFSQWIKAVFGGGIARLFMEPYNFKVWAHPPQAMDFQWIGERVSVIDLRRVLKNIVLEQDDLSWGPNNTFKFPLRGGTGEIFTRLGRTMQEHIRTGTKVVRVDPERKTVTTADGQRYSYRYLLNTAPLDRLVLEQIRPEHTPLLRAAESLKHNGVHVTGIGVAPPRTDTKCWMYFPETDCPFYRVTNFHNYSPNNTPPGFQGRALMAETSFSGHKPESPETVLDRTIQGLHSSSMIVREERENIATRWETRVEYGYPIPCLERDAALSDLQPFLEERDLFSRGRFGGWKYEVGNMDHSVMQGVEWAERMVLGKEEQTYTW